MRRYHFDWNEVKASIIDIILMNLGPISEPDIVEKIKEKYGEFNRATVNKHLKGLEELECIGKISSITNSRANFWDIKTTDNLKNIKRRLQNIRLDLYDKSFNIIIDEQTCNGFLTSIDSTDAHRLRVQLLLSYSFFEKCLETGIGSLYTKAYEIDPLGEDFTEDSEIEKLVEDMYMKFVKRISITPDIINSSDFVANQDCLKRLTKIQISREKLGEILASIPSNQEFGHISTSRFVNNFLTSITAELHSKFVSEIPGDFLLSNKIYHEISINVNDAFEQNAEELEQILYQIKISQYTSRKFVPDTIFQHFFERDVIEGNVTSEEKIFVRETKRLIKLSAKGKLETGLREELDNFYMKYYEEHKIKSA